MRNELGREVLSREPWPKQKLKKEGKPQILKSNIRSGEENSCEIYGGKEFWLKRLVVDAYTMKNFFAVVNNGLENDVEMQCVVMISDAKILL